MVSNPINVQVPDPRQVLSAPGALAVILPAPAAAHHRRRAAAAEPRRGDERSAALPQDLPALRLRPPPQVPMCGG